MNYRLCIVPFITICLGLLSCDKELYVDFVIYNQTDHELMIVESLSLRTMEDILPTEIHKVSPSLSKSDTTLIIPPYGSYKENHCLGIFGWRDHVTSDIDFASYNIIPMWKSIKAIVIAGDTLSREVYGEEDAWLYSEDRGSARFTLIIDNY